MDGWMDGWMDGQEVQTCAGMKTLVCRCNSIMHAILEPQHHMDTNVYTVNGLEIQVQYNIVGNRGCECEYIPLVQIYVCVYMYMYIRI